jgi:hypothetical protein
MSREKQIEEMAVDMCLIDRCKHLPQAECNNTTCAHCEAEALYNAGYRKQSEGEWIDKPTGAYSRMQSWCSACGKHSGIGGIESNRHKPYCPNCGARMSGGKADE